MTIRKKALGIVGLVVITLVAALTTASYILVTGRFARLEAKETERQVLQLRNELNSLLSGLEATAADWAPWDDTYQFIETYSDAYVHNNLVDSTFTNLNLDFMLFFRPGGKLFYKKIYEPDPSQPVIGPDQLVAAIERYPALLAQDDAHRRTSGIVMTASGPCLVAAHPIVTSEFNGPIRGTLVLGRVLESREIASIGAASQIDVTITPLALAADGPAREVRAALRAPGVIGTAPLDANTILGYVTISDLNGRPALLLETKRSREIYGYGLAMWRQNGIVLAGFSLVLIALLMFLLDRIILNRLGALSAKVNQIAHCINCSERLEIEDPDEIGQLAESINAMLAALQQFHEEKLDNEDHLRRLLDSINCGVIVVDAQSHLIMDINKAALGMFKGRREAVIGKLCHQLVCPNEEGSCPVTDQGKTLDLSERRLLQSDGRQLPIIKSVATIERGDHTLLIESFIDISKLKKAEENLRQSEERYRLFFEEDITGDFLLSVDGRILDCNPAFARMFGYRHPDEIKSYVPDGDYIAKEDRRMLIHRLRDEGRLVGIELELRHRDGHPLYCIGNLIGQFDATGTLREIKGYLFNDTKRVRLEKDLRRAQKMEAIGTLAGGIAHDFNNILAGIMGYTEIAQCEIPQDSQAAGRLQLVMKSANRAKDLVHQILAFSRQSEGEGHPLSPNPIIKEVAKLMRASLPTTIDIFEQLQSSAKVMANPIQIHQMIMNLCTNAGYAMKKSGGQLSINVTDTILDKAFTDRHPGVRQGRFVRLSVADTGPGIPPAAIERIFDPFFTTKTKNEGTGLGLSVVHGIVSKLKGAITVESNPSGSRFDVYLPAVEAGAQPVAKQPAAPLATGTEDIIFIDDEELLVEIGTHMLGTLGYHVTGFTDSQKALSHILANADRIDLVITDMTMPGLTGLVLARKVKERFAHLPVIICTGYSEEISQETSQAMGINGYVMKPMVIKELAAEIRKVLDGGASVSGPDTVCNFQ